MKKQITKWLLLSCFVMIGVAGFAQKSVSGIITDADNGEPLIGASILAKGTTVGTITDIDGSYSLNVPEGTEAIVVSYTGYSDQEILIGDRTTIDVGLGAGTILDEVVVVGYGTQKSKEITGSVASVGEEDFNVGNVTSAAQLLQGKVAGLTISKGNGDPNGSLGIRLRGLSTIGAQAEPLVVLDGVPGASLSNIDPQDIASIDVLKDGSAAAIYGTRGSSGVIIVTTKKGSKGNAKITYSGYGSSESIARTPAIATAQEFRDAGGNDAGASTDWYKEISQTALSQSHNIALSGGSNNTNYRVAFNYRDQAGVVKNTGFNQLNTNVSINQKALDNKLNLGVNLIVTDRNSQLGLPEAFRYATTFNPTSAVFNDDGTYNNPSGFDVFNPVAMVELGELNQERTEILANMTASYNITPALKVTGTYAKQKKDTDVSEYYPSNLVYRNGQRTGTARRANVKTSNDLYEGTLQYIGEAGNLNYTLLAGTSFQKFNSGGFIGDNADFLLDFNGSNQLGDGADKNDGSALLGSFGNFYRLQAQFGRVNFNIDDTYFVSASVRREGSDRFGEANRYGVFPAVSAGVNLAKLANLENVDNLKLRVGYGVTGNLPSENYLFESVFVQGPQFFFNGGFVPSYGPLRNANPDLKWETKKELNLGFDFALLDSKLNGSLDVFNRKTEDLILNTPVPVPPNLAAFTWKNVASLTTNGVELLLNYDVVNNENFSYSPTLIFTTYKTILDTYLEDTPSQFITNLGAPGQNLVGLGLNLLEEGKELGQIVAPEFARLDDLGNALFIDQSTGEAIEKTALESEDWIIVGNGLPDFELSLNNTFTIGNFDLNLFFRGAFGHSLVNTYRAFYEAFPDNAGANFVRTDKATEGLKAASYSSEHVEDASFVKLDNASLGYTFDTASSKIGSCRLYLAGQNLFTITGYTGVDPDVRLGDPGSTDNGRRVNGDIFGLEGAPLNILAPGIDRRNTYFSTRTVTLGLNISF